jgi:hypothetical protein
MTIDLATWAPVDIVAVEVPGMPEPSPPPGGQELYDLVAGAAFWSGMAVTIVVAVVIGIRVVGGMRGRSQSAADALGHLPYVLVGSTLITVAVPIVEALYSG